MFDIAEDVMAQTPLFIARGLNECEQRLLELQALFRKGSHIYDGNDHKHLSVTWETCFRKTSRRPITSKTREKGIFASSSPFTFYLCDALRPASLLDGNELTLHDQRVKRDRSRILGAPRGNADRFKFSHHRLAEGLGNGPSTFDLHRGRSFLRATANYLTRL